MAKPTSEHIVSSYEDELIHLAASIAEMGGAVENAISSSIDALLKVDHTAAREILAADAKIDEMQRNIDETAVSMIARRQPMAADLRMIVASIHVANDLERVGDMAKTICRRTLQLDGARLSPKFYNGVRHMTDLTLRQLKDALDVYATRDIDSALTVCERDAELDALYVSLFRELLTYMMEDPRNITMCTHLLFCAKNLERIGDHATNIAETLHFLITGVVLADERPKQDKSSLTSVEYNES
jgi:phosphate transport system protein